MDRIDEFLDRDGICGFRLIPVDKAEELRSHLTERNFRFDTWDVFLADQVTAMAASEAIISRGLPDGLADLDRPTQPEDEYTARIQMLMGAAGVVPFSGSLLVGALGPATTVAVGVGDGIIAAAARGYLPHNVHSPYHRYAWGGLLRWRDRSGAWASATTLTPAWSSACSKTSARRTSMSSYRRRTFRPGAWSRRAGFAMSRALSAGSRRPTRARILPGRCHW